MSSRLNLKMLFYSEFLKLMLCISFTVVHGSAMSLVSTASSSLYSTPEDKQAQEVRRLKKDLSEAQQKVHTLTSQLSTNVSNTHFLCSQLFKIFFVILKWKIYYLRSNNYANYSAFIWFWHPLSKVLIFRVRSVRLAKCFYAFSFSNTSYWYFSRNKLPTSHF